MAFQKLVHLLDINFLHLILQEICLIPPFHQGNQVGSPPRNLLRNPLEDRSNRRLTVLRTPSLGNRLEVRKVQVVEVRKVQVVAQIPAAPSTLSPTHTQLQQE